MSIGIHADAVQFTEPHHLSVASEMISQASKHGL